MRCLSYSAWSTWKACPKKYYFSYIEKLPRSEPGPAAQRGTAIHQEVEDFMAGKIDRLTQDVLEPYEDFLKALAGMTNYPELRFTFDGEWEVCDRKDLKAHWTGFIDLEVHDPEDEEFPVEAMEWKTGKVYPEHADQSDMYGMSLLLRYPKIPRVKVTNVYFDQRQSVPRVYEREDLPAQTAIWGARHRDVHRDEIYPACPSWRCRFCDFAKDKGGPCKF